MARYYPKSDHCDGSRFFNPTGPVKAGPMAVLKMLLSLRLEKWPALVENSPALDLKRVLKVGEVAVTFVNHATFLIQCPGGTFLTDPVWSDRASPANWSGPKRHRSPGIAFEDLPAVDFVLISHNHYDHLDVPTLQRLHEKFHPRFLVPLGNKSFLEASGLANVVELDWWQGAELAPGVKVVLAPAHHLSGRGLFDKYKTLWGSYAVSVNGRSIYFAADSAYAPHFKAIHARLGPPDLALLPIGAYEPREFMKAIHMNPDDAVQAHLDLAAKQSIGMHLGTFQLTNEKIDQPVRDLAQALEGRNIPRSQFIVLGEGRTQFIELESQSLSRDRLA